MPGCRHRASLSFAQGSHDFESLDRGIGRGDRFETAHRLDQYLELSVIGLDHVIEILHLPVGRLPGPAFLRASIR